MSGTTSVDGPLDQGRDVVMHGAPGRLVTISPTREGALAFFAFRSPELTDLDFRDSEQHKRVLAGAFANGSWRVPELLERVREADDIYFDSVSQVTLDRWSSGRVALVGDAASSVSLFGGRSSLAISGAFTLAEQLARDPKTTSAPSAATRRSTANGWSRSSETSSWLPREQGATQRRGEEPSGFNGHVRVLIAGRPNYPSARIINAQSAGAHCDRSTVRRAALSLIPEPRDQQGFVQRRSGVRAMGGGLTDLVDSKGRVRGRASAVAAS